MDETAASIGISTPGVYGLVEQGKLETFVVGRRRLARIEAIARCVQTLEKEAPPIPSRTGANNRSPADGSAA
jgi:hypothetical protein